MSDPNTHSHAPSQAEKADTARAEALSWLASRYRWEQLLTDLHELIERESGVVKLPAKADEAKDDSSAA